MTRKEAVALQKLGQQRAPTEKSERRLAAVFLRRLAALTVDDLRLVHSSSDEELAELLPAINDRGAWLLRQLAPAVEAEMQERAAHRDRGKTEA